MFLLRLWRSRLVLSKLLHVVLILECPYACLLALRHAYQPIMARPAGDGYQVPALQPQQGKPVYIGPFLLLEGYAVNHCGYAKLSRLEVFYMNSHFTHR